MENLNRIEELCNRAKRLNLLHCDVIAATDTVEKVEHGLGIVLPFDFVEITKRFPYDGMTATCEFFEFDETLKPYSQKRNIDALRYNLYYRKEYKNLDDIFVLSRMDDVSFLLMFTQDDRQKPTPIVWCDYEDLYNYSETGEFKYKIDKWNSFTDFFEFLIEKEEEAIKEEKELAEAKTKLPPPEKSFWQRLFRK